MSFASYRCVLKVGGNLTVWRREGIFFEVNIFFWANHQSGLTRAIDPKWNSMDLRFSRRHSRHRVVVQKIVQKNSRMSSIERYSIGIKKGDSNGRCNIV